jgi:hypothetical protein
MSFDRHDAGGPARASRLDRFWVDAAFKMNVNAYKKLRPRTAIFYFNRLLGRYRQVIWVIGESRSGTTLLADLLGTFGAYRTMFEPFHPIEVEKSAFLPMLTYRRPSANDPQLRKFASKVFSGALIHPRVDDKLDKAVLHDGLIVKDIFASLIAGWVMQRLPGIKPILMVRNPFAVARSRRERRDWAWLERPAELLKQRDLIDDHFNARQVAALEDADRSGDFLICQIAIWAAVHWVIFRQFSPGDLHMLFYENLICDPEKEMARLAEWLSSPLPRRTDIERVLGKPAKFATAAGVERARNTTDAWRSGLSDDELSRGFAVLSVFDLATMYDRRGRPSGSNLEYFCRRS